MRFFFDTEFIEDGRTIDLMSIGIVREDGEAIYSEIEECDLSRAGDWVKANVITKLTGPREPRAVVRDAIIEFCGEKPEFWAYYGAYDWVAFCQLFGTMMDLPKGWPMMCFDIKQLAMSRGNPQLPTQFDADAHNALNDAFWTKHAFEQLIAMPPVMWP